MNTNFCKNGECSRCCSCCTPFLPMSKSEVNKVKKFLNENEDIYIQALKNEYIGSDEITIRCCFAKDNRCLIYPVRPWICKAYKCDQTQEEMEKNKEIATNKAAYNTLDIRTVNDFRNLLFKDAGLVIAGIIHFLEVKDVDELEEFVKQLQRPDLLRYVERMKKDGN